MWNSILCLIDDIPWHNPSCLKGTCAQCGIDMLLICFVEEDTTCSQLILVDLDLGKEKFITKYHYYLSGDTEHDTLFV
jgi:hypothetical protein